MCYRPLHITANNVYRNTNVSASTYDVPCGKCESCRDAYRNMWKCRLWHELDYTNNHGGTAVFLTFTYNDEHLPLIEVNGSKIPCFNHQDVKTFLNRLKIRMYRMYGKNSYKYFIAMEYGKNTKRQHLHGLFTLASCVDWKVFTELCRDLWSDKGYMFPKRDKYGRYVKDDGTDDTPLIRSIVKGCIYVSKYVTKDLSYYDIPSVDAAIKFDKAFARKFGPRHYQSNNLGISILDKVNLADNEAVVSFLSDGIVVPYATCRIPVPRYIKKKLLFDNVKSDRIGRNNKFLYDSVPSSLCLAVRSLLYERKASKLIDSIKKLFGRYAALHPDISLPLGIDYPLLSNYILYFKNVDNNVLSSFLIYYEDDLSAFSDFSRVGFFYNLSKDNNFLKNNLYVTDRINTFPYSAVFDDKLLDAYMLYLRASSECEQLQVSEFHKRSVERENVRYKYFYKYPKNLC